MRPDQLTLFHRQRPGQRLMARLDLYRELQPVFLKSANQSPRHSKPDKKALETEGCSKAWHPNESTI